MFEFWFYINLQNVEYGQFRATSFLCFNGKKVKT